MFPPRYTTLDVMYHVSRKGVVKTVPVIITRTKLLSDVPTPMRAPLMPEGTCLWYEMYDSAHGLYRVVYRGRVGRKWKFVSKELKCSPKL